MTPVAIKNWSMAQKKGHHHGSKRATKDGGQSNARFVFFSTNPGVFVIAQLATLAPNLSSATIYSDDSKEEVEVAELWRC